MALALNHLGTPVAGDAAAAVAAAGTVIAVSTSVLAPTMRRSTRLPDVIMIPSKEAGMPPGNDLPVSYSAPRIRPGHRTTATT
jgi:hypothetical protein